jgi:hypothetical protein
MCYMYRIMVLELENHVEYNFVLNFFGKIKEKI